MMNTDFETVTLELDVDHALSIDFDDEEGVVIRATISLYGEEEAKNKDVSMSIVLDDCLKTHTVTQDYRKLYCIAHELQRYAIKLRELAQQIEDDTQIEDLFNIEPDDM